MSLLFQLLLNSFGANVLVLFADNGYLLVWVQEPVRRRVLAHIGCTSLARVRLLPVITGGTLKCWLNLTAELYILEQLYRLDLLGWGATVLVGWLRPIRFLLHAFAVEATALLVGNSLHFLVDVVGLVAHHNTNVVLIQIKVVNRWLLV